jgi:hypothetical protein
MSVKEEERPNQFKSSHFQFNALWLVDFYLFVLLVDISILIYAFFTPTFFRNTTTTYNTALVVSSINTAVQHYYNHTDIYNLHKAHTARLNW